MRTVNGTSVSLTVVITVLVSSVLGMVQTGQERSLVSQTKYDEWLAPLPIPNGTGSPVNPIAVF